MSMSSPLLRLLLVGLFSVLLSPLANAEAAKRLRIGITLHPYYSYVKRTSSATRPRWCR
jgi:zinc transport system substrate-binding protein